MCGEGSAGGRDGGVLEQGESGAGGREDGVGGNESEWFASISQRTFGKEVRCCHPGMDQPTSSGKRGG